MRAMAAGMPSVAEERINVTCMDPAMTEVDAHFGVNEKPDKRKFDHVFGEGPHHQQRFDDLFAGPHAASRARVPAPHVADAYNDMFGQDLSVPSSPHPSALQTPARVTALHGADAFNDMFGQDLCVASSPHPSALQTPVAIAQYTQPQLSQYTQVLSRQQPITNTGARRPPKQKKCQCKQHTLELKPLVIRVRKTTPEMMVRDELLKTSMRENGMTHMKTCNCKIPYLFCNVCPENFSDYGNGYATAGGGKQSCYAISADSKRTAAKAHFASASHVFWRTVHAMSAILYDVQIAKTRANYAKQPAQWHTLMQPDSLWAKEKWTQQNWELCCNIVISGRRKFLEWKINYQIGMQGVFDNKENPIRIAMIFNRAEVLLEYIGFDEYVQSPVQYGTPMPSALPLGYSSTKDDQSV